MINSSWSDGHLSGTRILGIEPPGLEHFGEHVDDGTTDYANLVMFDADNKK